MNALIASFVTVKIKSSHFDFSGAEDFIETFAIGKKNVQNGKVYIYYGEPAETGMEETHTLLKLQDGKVFLTRTGEVEQKLEFSSGELTHCQYRMPFGSIDMSVDTKKLEITENGDCIDIKIEYILTMNGRMHGLTKMHIQVEEDTKVGH